MAGVLGKTFKMLLGVDDTWTPNLSFRSRPTRRQLIQRESEIGGKLFGQIPHGHHRQFFNLDAKTWVWYEEWTEDGKTKNATTRYEVHENGVLKVQDGSPYYYIEGEELRNFLYTIQAYYERVGRDVYKYDTTTGRPLVSHA